MSKNPIVVSSDMPLANALELMEGERKVYVLPVVEANGQVLGVIRMHDIIGHR